MSCDDYKRTLVHTYMSIHVDQQSTTFPSNVFFIPVGSIFCLELFSLCSFGMQIQNIFSYTYHIESLDACMEY
jgi:hypothetical protein